ALGPFRQRQGERHRDTAAQGAPGQHLPRARGQPEEALQDSHGQSDREKPRADGYRDRHRGRERELADRRHQEEHLHADQREEHRVQDLVYQLPEYIEVVARRVRHRESAALVADDESRDHHRERSRYVQLVSERVAADYRGKRQQHLGLIAVDALQQPERDIAEDGAVGKSSSRFLREQEQTFLRRRREAAVEHPQEEGEDDHTDAVIEQGFSRDDQLELPGRAGRLEYAHHRERVGGRDERSEQQAIDERQLQAHDRQR